MLPGPKSSFPPEFANATRLGYYASLFNTLEINSSFYKIPMATTFAKWAKEVPKEFTFSVKLWRGITHSKKLNYLPADIDRFMEAANHLGKNVGCLLIQFPASIHVNYVSQVEAIIARVKQGDAHHQWKIAVEFRHPDWYEPGIYSLLKKHHASLVIHDMPGSATPADYLPADLAYFRYHGPSGTYRDAYSEEFIAAQAKKIQWLADNGREVYAYFNNTMDGALPNVLRIKSLLGE